MATLSIYEAREVMVDVREIKKKAMSYYTATGIPYVIAKWAMTLDGRIALDNGDSKWITSEAERKELHHLRYQLGAVLVGSNTVQIDDPQLTPYLIDDLSIDKNRSIRIILDSRGNVSPQSNVVKSAHIHKTIIATTERSPQIWRQQMSDYGVEIIILSESNNGKVDLPSLLIELGKRGISGVLVEGGREVLTSFIKEKIVNKIYVHIAPKLIGGNKPFSPLFGLNISNMGGALKLRYEEIGMVGDDIFIIADFV